MKSYLGRMISTALPRISSSRASPYTTSARPPTLATGVSSDAIITTNMTGMAGRGGGAASRAGGGSSASGSGFFNLGISLTTACSETGGAGGVTGFCGGSDLRGIDAGEAATAPSVSEIIFVSGTGLVSATGFVAAVEAVSIPCLMTADCNASASGLMPAAGLISVAGFTGGVAPAVGGCGAVVNSEAAVAAGSDGWFGSDLAGEAATAEIFFWARFFAGSFCRGLAIHLQSWFACEKIKLIGKTKLSQEISRRVNFSPTGLIHPPCMPYLRTNRKVRVTQQGHAHCVPAYVLDAGISKSPCIRVGFHV